MMEVKKGLIGVIMPIYNTEKYLTKSIRSVLRQSYKNFIVVLVNDCSPDNSLEICKRFKESDSRIFIVDKGYNEGVQYARFEGIEKARMLGCEFVTFLDSDDWLRSDALELMINAQKKHNADIVEARSYRCWSLYKKENKGNLTEFADMESVVISQPELYDKYFISYFGINKLGVNMWSKLYRISLYDPSIVRACDYRMGEDLYANMHILPHVQRYCYLNRPIYNYRYGGMTTKYNPHLWPDLKHMYSDKLLFAENLGYEKAFIPASIELKNILMSTIAMRLDFNHSSNDIKSDLIKEFNDDVWNKFKGYVSSYANEKKDRELLAVLSKDIDGIMYMAAMRNKTFRARSKKAILRIINIFSSNH